MVRGPNFTLHQAESLVGSARLGLVLPKRLARLAVTRNLVRRQAREAFRARAPNLPSLDLVLRLTRTLKFGGDRESLRQSCRTEIENLLSLVCGNAAASI